MNWTSGTERSAPAEAPGGARRSPGWWAGLDAARGLALIGLVAVQVLPGHSAATPAPAWPHLLLSQTSAALFVLLAGVGLALGSGGRFPHRGRWLAADRAGTAVRAALLAGVGLGVGALRPEGAPADELLLCCGVLLVLAVPLLHLSATALFVCAAGLWTVGPVLVQGLTEVLPAFAGVPAEPGGTVSRLLVTGAYPVLPYLSCLLAGLGVGRLHLRDTGIQVRLLAAGAGLVVLARTADPFVPYVFGGAGRVPVTGGAGADELAEVLVRGPDPWPVDGVWAIVAGLGAALLVLGGCLLASRRSGAWWLRLSAVGATALSLYTAHLVALSVELRHDLPSVWSVVHLGAVLLLALGWHRARGRGPVERVLGAGGDAGRRAVLHRHRRLHRT